MCAVGEARQTVCSISLGGVEAIARKGSTSVPNEDALFAADFGPLAFHAVADGHRGHFASHEAIERIAEFINEPAALAKALHSLDWLTTPTPEPDPEDASATTLSLCVIDRANGKLGGWSAGDSAVFHLNLTKGVRRLDTPDTAYLSPRDETPPTNVALHRFETTVRPGDVILSCSDGVFDRVDVYDPLDRTWRVEAAMPRPRHGTFPVLFQSRIYLPGGGERAGFAQSRTFDVFQRR